MREREQEREKEKERESEVGWVNALMAETSMTGPFISSLDRQVI